MNRPAQIMETYEQLIDQHLRDLLDGMVTEMFEIEDFAERMFIHPTHLSNVIKEISGTSACAVYQMKIIAVAMQLLDRPDMAIQDVAWALCFDPSQFTKWFKRIKGITPRQYRVQVTPQG